MTLRVAPGHKVRMHFTIRLNGDEIAETTQGDEPLEFLVGDGELDEGLEALINGMAAGESRSLEVAPGVAFDERDEDAVRPLPMTDFEDLEVEPGVVVEFEGENGEAVPAVIIEVGDTEAVVDFNHPLSGRPFGFDVTILSIE